jgi:hypothetical protein
MIKHLSTCAVSAALLKDLLFSDASNDMPQRRPGCPPSMRHFKHARQSMPRPQLPPTTPRTKRKSTWELSSPDNAVRMHHDGQVDRPGFHDAIRGFVQEEVGVVVVQVRLDVLPEGGSISSF